MKFACPRVIRGNRGDLLSRYGILTALHKMGMVDIVVFCEKDQHIFPLKYPTVGYGHLYNLFPNKEGLQALVQADAVLWTAGLDLQDDSSLVKLLHTLCVFSSYRLLGLKIYVLMQGAGPLTTRWGRTLTRLILNNVDTFIARDRGTLKLLQQLKSRTRLVLGHDGIFLGDFSQATPSPEEKQYIDKLTAKNNSQPLIGFNLRQWFHFASSILPYQYARKKYQTRSQQKMAEFLQTSILFLKELRRRFDAKILLISMYEPGIEPWEDDLPYLQAVKSGLVEDDNIIVVDKPLSIGAFCNLMAKLDLMVGTRLHSTLAALRFGVPAVNLSYTLKGKDIFMDLGLASNSIDLDDFFNEFPIVLHLVETNLQNTNSRNRMQKIALQTTEFNKGILEQVLRKIT